MWEKSKKQSMYEQNGSISKEIEDLKRNKLKGNFRAEKYSN